ncbi:MAG: YbhB/YbcL family Raf kinase inhibitor-like protein [Parachlamydiales bacterium]
MKLTSAAFKHEGEIPRRYTCQGEDLSPPLAWEGAPKGTATFALIVDDPDAPDPAAPKMCYVHWVLYNLPPTCIRLAEATKPVGDQGLNDWKRTGYGGPCPPIGRHRYYFKLYALDTHLEGLSRPTKDQLLKAMEGHILAETHLMGTYQKS